jgi:hypothetical protein
MVAGKMDVVRAGKTVGTWLGVRMKILWMH